MKLFTDKRLPMRGEKMKQFEIEAGNLKLAESSILGYIPKAKKKSVKTMKCIDTKIYTI